MLPKPNLTTHFDKQLRFSRLTTDNGLPHATVSTVLQSQQGFIWLGTQNGLARYDGYDILVYQHEHDNHHSLSHNNIFTLIESQDGLLWIGTDLGGLNVFDPRTLQFRCYKNDPENPASLLNDSVWSLLEDASGDIWVGTRAGLSRLDRKTDTFRHYFPTRDNPRALAGSVIYRIYQDRGGTIWLGTNKGLARYHRATDDFTIYRHDPQNPESLSHDSVWALLEDRQGNFWIGTRGGGLNHYERTTGIFTVYQHNLRDPATISDNKLWQIFEDHAGNLWITTENGGLNRFDPQTQTFVAFQHNPNDPYSISSNDVFWICEDRSGVLWITSRYGGVNLLSPALQRFVHYRNIPGNQHAITENNIYAILAEADGNLWMGSFGGGLYCLNRTTGEMQAFKHDPHDPHSISHNKIYCIHRDPAGILWLATSGGGLNRLDPHSGKFTAYRYTEQQPDVIGSSFLTTIADAGDGLLWVGSLGFGLSLFDPAAGKLVAEFMHDPADPYSLAEDTIYDLAPDTAGNLWIATARGGLNWLNRQTGQITRYLCTPNTSNCLIDNTVHALYLDEARQTLWVGTGNSLSYLHLPDEKWHHYTTSDGLPSNTVNGIQPDDLGRLWISTNRGLSCFDPITEEFRNFNALDGLQGNQFYIASAHRGPDGRLYFGGPNGLTEFQPSQIDRDHAHPPVVLTGFELFNQPVKVGSDLLPLPVEYLDKLVLKHDQSVLSFAFAALGYQLSDKNLYRYKMEGFDQSWSPPRPIRHATYTNLKRGRYTFRVQACNHDGYWSNNPLALEIEILPAWWRTWWFRAGVIACGTLAVGGAIYLRMRQNQALNRELEQRVKTRTRQLTSEVSLRQVAEQELRKINQTLQSKLDTITSLQHQLRQQAIRDPLTGLYNRRYLDEFLASEFPRARRGKYSIAFLLFDLDHFKKINDTYGHHTGDIALKDVAEILKVHTRCSDFACRYGGEEFLVILPETEMDQAVLRAEQFRRLVEQNQIHCRDTLVRMTTSIGIAIFPAHGDEQEKILQRVDAALYQAKLDGRNRICVYQNSD